MKICVIGMGYVGLVTGGCLANLGNEVVCVDKDKKKITALKKGNVPFFEPGLADLIEQNIHANRIKFTDDLIYGINQSEVVFIAVGTPPKKSGEADTSAVVEVAKVIAGVLKSKPHHKVIVNKSTVPVGMGDIISKILTQNNISEEKFAVVSNPEFLREGSAIFDFMHPKRIVIGASNNKAINIITELYRPLNAHIIFTSIKSAELIKYAANAFLATKISFINEVANICEKVGVDVSDVAYAIGLDPRIGNEFLKAGIGYGGSCFPKDVAALIHVANENGYSPKILSAVIETNNFQIEMFFDKIYQRLKKNKYQQITVLGLSFKPGTSDLRESPALKVVDRLRKIGVKIIAYDPSLQVKSIAGIKLSHDIYSAITGSHALVVATEWPEFQGLDFKRIKMLMKDPVIFDGRNMFDAKRMRELGFVYNGVGR